MCSIRESINVSDKNFSHVYLQLTKPPRALAIETNVGTHRRHRERVEFDNSMECKPWLGIFVKHSKLAHFRIFVILSF